MCVGCRNCIQYALCIAESEHGVGCDTGSLLVISGYQETVVGLHATAAFTLWAAKLLQDAGRVPFKLLLEASKFPICSKTAMYASHMGHWMACKTCLHNARGVGACYDGHCWMQYAFSDGVNTLADSTLFTTLMFLSIYEHHGQYNVALVTMFLLTSL